MPDIITETCAHVCYTVDQYRDGLISSKELLRSLILTLEDISPEALTLDPEDKPQ